MKRKILPLVMAVVVPALILAGCQTAKKPAPQDQENNKAPQAASLIELAGKDPFEQGCVSCHQKKDEADRSLPAKVKEIAGHPEVRENTVDACYYCHDPNKSQGLWKKFYQLMHKVHWASEIFYQNNNGQCYSCHTVERTGISGIKNYPPAGDRSLVSGGAAPKAKAKTEKPAQEDQQKEQAQPEQQQQQQQQQLQETEQSETRENNEELPTPTP